MSAVFVKYLDKDSVIVLQGTNKMEVLSELIEVAALKAKVPRDVVAGLTWNREKMMTTGVGGSLALPHIRVEDIPYPVIFIGICANPIEDYESQDGDPVKVIVYIAAPEGNQDEYLKLLGAISCKFRKPEVIQALIEKADDLATAYDLIIAE
jgi:nitrogen PTS system EIIA component